METAKFFSRRTVSPLFLLALALVIFPSFQVQAGTKTFDGGTTGTGTALDTAANWNPDGIPATGDESLLDNSVITLPTTLTTTGANAIYGDLIWNNNVTSKITINTATTTSRSITLSGGGGSTAATAAGGATGDLLNLGSTATVNTLTIGGNDGAGTGRLNLVLGADGNFDVVNSGATLIISGVLSGTFNLTKTGSGSLTLNNVNTFGAGKIFELKAGTVNVNSAKALGSATTTFQIDGGTTIDNTSGAAIILGNAYPITINGDFTFAGASDGTHDLTTGAGATTLGAASGTSRTITTSAGNLTLAGAIGNGTTANQIIKSGSGILTLSGANTYSGLTTVSAGTLTLSGASTGTGGFTLNAGALNVNAAGVAGTSGPLGNGGTLTINGGIIDNTSGSAKTLLNVNPISVGGAFAFAGAADATHDLKLSGNVDLGGLTRTITTSGSGGTLNLAGVISNGGITKSGAGTLTLTNANTFSGGVNILSGTVAVNIANITNSFLGTGTVTLGDSSGNNSATLYASAASNGTGVTNALTVAAGTTGALTIAALNASLSLSGNLALNNNLTVTNQNSGKTISFGGITTETSVSSPALTIASGTLGNTIFSGGLVVGSGGLTLANNAGQIFTVGAGNVTSSSTGNLTFNANNTGAFTVSAASVNNAGVITNAGIGSGATTINGSIGGNVTAVVQNSATSALTLAGTNTYTGPTIISAGTLALGVNSSISNSTSISIAAGATNDVSAIASFNLSSSTALKASGTGASAGTAAVIKGGTTVNLNSQLIILTIAPTSMVDTTHPALLVSSGALTLNNNAFTITNNSGSPLAAGSYRVIQVGDGSTGTINQAGSPAYSVNVYLPNGASGLVSGATASISVSSGNVVLAVTTGTLIVPTTTALTSSANPSTYGGSVTFTATVQTNSPSGNAIGANSNFVFYVDGTAVATNLASGSTATYTISSLTASSHTIQAIYLGDVTYGSSTNSLIQANNARAVVFTGVRTYDGTTIAANTILTISNLVSPDNFGVTGSAGLAGANVGTNLIISTNLLVLPSTGAATNYTLVGASGSVVITNAFSNIQLVSSAQTNGYLSGVNFTSMVPTFVNSGSVIFLANNSAFSTNVITNGVAYSLSVATLPRGTNIVTVTFVGDANVLGSTNSLNQIVTNHPPVASAANYTRNAAVNQIKIAITNLLTNATDVDGDSLTLASVSVTTNATTLIVSGGWVLYYNTNAVADQFSYTVSDGFGGTNSAIVTINIDSTPLFGQSTVASTSGGTATLNFAGIPTYSYSVNRSTNLTDWVTIWTTNAPVGGVFQYMDTSAPTPSAYYQLQFNP